MRESVPLLAWTDEQGRQKKLPPKLEAWLASYGIREWARDRW